MGAYLARRLLSFIPSILLVYTIVFTLVHLTPGNPWDNIDKPFAPEVLSSLEAKYHLDDPLWKQYLTYLEGIVTRFDFGPSYKRNQSANEIIAAYFPVSLQLGSVAFGLALIGGLSLGIVSAIRHNSLVDRLAMFFSVCGVATPSFVVTTLLILVLAVNLHLVPTRGWDGILSKEVIIPAVALALGPMAVLARYARAAMLDTLHMDYLRTARAKGLSSIPVIMRHAL